MDVISIAHREPEELSLATIEAMLSELPESSATMRRHSPYLVDMNGFLQARLIDVTMQIALGKRALPQDQSMVNLITRKAPKESLEELRAAAETGVEIFERRRLEKLAARKALEASEAAQSDQTG